MTYFFEIYGVLPRAGPGVQTLELARLSKGTVIALDNHQPFLDKLKTDTKKGKLLEHIKFLNQDMNTMAFEPESFDIIWAARITIIRYSATSLFLLAPG